MMDESAPNVGHSFRYAVQESSETTELATISYHNVNVAVKQRSIQTGPWGLPRVTVHLKQVLQGVSGIMKPGMNAIMGPSGAGKSTLLDVLAKRRFPTSPDSRVALNGLPLPKNYNLVSGYVTQDIMIMGTLTIRENLQFSASLRLSSNKSSVDRTNRVNELLEDLDLEAVADTKVGSLQDIEVGRGVSGGERKRTQIGMELVPAPGILYLDEPTSGLDSFTAVSVIKLLRNLGDRGKTIIFSIHQPRYSIFQMFDSVTLLGESETVYHGPALNAKEYFQRQGCVCGEHENPPDMFLDFIQDHGRQLEHDASLAQKFKDSSFARATEEELEKSGAFIDNQAQRRRSVTYPSSFLRQLLVISKRTLLNFKRLHTALRAQIALNLFLALLVGFVFFQLNDNPETAIQNRTGAFFLIIMTVVFTNMPAVEMFVKQRALFMHESASGYYRVSSYFLARVLCDMLPLRVIPVLFFSLVSYWMIGLTHSVSHFFFFVLDILLTALSTSSFAFLYSSIASQVVLALLMLASTMIIMLIFGGLFVNLSSPPVFLRWIKWVSIIRYSMEALCISELKDKEYCFEKINGTCTMKNATAYGNVYLKQQDFHRNDKWKTQIVLFAMFFGVLVLTYIRLRRKRVRVCVPLNHADLL